MEGPKFLGEKTPSPRSNEFSMKKNLSSPRKHMFQIFLKLEAPHVQFYVGLQLIIRKVLRRAITLLLEAL
jgi:hypothetical protein